jgi:hypothetical protein
MLSDRAWSFKPSLGAKAKALLVPVRVLRRKRFNDSFMPQAIRCGLGVVDRQTDMIHENGGWLTRDRIAITNFIGAKYEGLEAFRSQTMRFIHQSRVEGMPTSEFERLRFANRTYGSIYRI